ncbi:unnamed protein product [Moneuplotes crassus]|uniref:C2H2-type domain-containing protein n=1 Tax=Euplotes crassus TaxID=5936 RepID=A0AAD1X629_EUPCR|nr:unnamed protein product [Moneuplotes crassus]
MEEDAQNPAEVEEPNQPFAGGIHKAQDPELLQPNQIIDTFGILCNHLVQINLEHIGEIIQFLDEISMSLETDRKIAQALIMIINKSDSLAKLPKIVLLSEMAKREPNRFIHHLEPRLLQIFCQAFLKDAEQNYRRELIKIFKAWKGIFNKRTLDEISERLKLPEMDKILFAREENESVDYSFTSKILAQQPTEQNPGIEQQQYSHLVQPIYQTELYKKDRLKGNKELDTSHDSGRADERDPCNDQDSLEQRGAHHSKGSSLGGLFSYIRKQYQRIYKDLKMQRNLDTALCWNPERAITDPEVTKSIKISDTVNSLYSDRAFQCTVCGIRLMQNSDLKTHLDVHFESNRKYFANLCKRSGGFNTRTEFSTKKAFLGEACKESMGLGSDKVTLFDLRSGDAKGEYSIEEHLPCEEFNSDVTSCLICGEQFQVLREMKKEEDFYIGVTKVEVNPNQFFLIHSKDCLKALRQESFEFTQMLKQKKNEKLPKTHQEGGMVAKHCEEKNSNHVTLKEAVHHFSPSTIPSHHSRSFDVPVISKEHNSLCGAKRKPDVEIENQDATKKSKLVENLNAESNNEVFQTELPVQTHCQDLLAKSAQLELKAPNSPLQH